MKDNKFKKRMKYLSKNPPSYIKKYAFKNSVKLPKEYLSSSNVTCFQIKVNKNYTEFFIEHSKDRNIILAENSPTDESILIFDVDKHGYDGIINKEKNTEQDSEMYSQICENCGCHEFEIIVQYQYSCDDEVFANVSFENQGIKSEDLFDWFVLIGKCIRCKEIKEIANWECA